MTSNPHYTMPYQDVCVVLIKQALRRGLRVVVMTCSPGEQVAQELRAAGIHCWADKQMRHMYWDEGTAMLVTGSPYTVLVTGRKVAHVCAYVDDRGFNWTHQQGTAGFWDALNKAMIRADHTP
jgi:hypothetical protein